MTHVYYKYGGGSGRGRRLCAAHPAGRYAIAAIIVFDVTRPATFDSVIKVGRGAWRRRCSGRCRHEARRRPGVRARQWQNDVNDKVMLANEKPVPILLIANKVRRPAAG